MVDFSTYGSLLYTQSFSGSSSGSISGSATTSGSVLAGMVNLTPPAIKFNTLNSRNHGSGKYPSKISAGTIDIDDFSAKFSFDPATLAVLQAAALAGTVGNYRISFPNNQNWYFGAIVSSIQPDGLDAQNPALMTESVTFSPSGAMVIV
jgi:hypothetical protein